MFQRARRIALRRHHHGQTPLPPTTPSPRPSIATPACHATPPPLARVQGVDDGIHAHARVQLVQAMLCQHRAAARIQPDRGAAIGMRIFRGSIGPVPIGHTGAVVRGAPFNWLIQPPIGRQAKYQALSPGQGPESAGCPAGRSGTMKKAPPGGAPAIVWRNRPGPAACVFSQNRLWAPGAIVANEPAQRGAARRRQGPGHKTSLQALMIILIFRRRRPRAPGRIKGRPARVLSPGSASLDERVEFSSERELPIEDARFSRQPLIGSKAGWPSNGFMSAIIMPCTPREADS